MSDHYDNLTEDERAYWDEYTRLRELSDWDGFTEAQDDRRQAARDWLVNQRKYIWRCAEGEVPGVDGGWDINQRSERYAQLKDDKLNTGSCRRVASLPRNGCTPAEKALIAERCTWWMVDSANDEQKRDKQDCTDWLVDRRKQVYGLIAEGSDAENAANARHDRYSNLCIATRYGSSYANWCETHDPATGAEKSTSTDSARATAVQRARSYLGVSENPPDSNRGTPQPDDWQERVLGYSGQPWCACFVTCMAWDAGVKGSGSAGVQMIVDMARNGQGMFRGWTTDGADALRGDFAVIGCTSCHIGMVADSDDPLHTIEGNTSPGTEGSQYNGGCVAEKHRSRGEVMGWALVDYP